MRLVPCTVKAARRFVAEVHRHLPEIQGGLFAVGVEDDAGQLRAVGIAGNPPRAWQGTGRLVIARVASDGFENACSAVYGALCRAAKALGYREAWTYTLPEEPGTSLRAAGFAEAGETEARAEGYDRPSRRRSAPVRPEAKRRWVRRLAAALLLALAAPLAAQEPPAPTWPPPVEEPAEEPEAVEPAPEPSSRWPELAVVAWCEVSGRDASKPVAEIEPDPESEGVGSIEDIGCDLGLGLSLYSWPIGKGGRYSIEAVVSIGERSVGAGLGWCRGRLCIGVGGAAIRDDLGINTDTLAPVAGATWSFGGLRE